LASATGAVVAGSLRFELKNFIGGFLSSSAMLDEGLADLFEDFSAFLLALESVLITEE